MKRIVNHMGILSLLVVAFCFVNTVFAFAAETDSSEIKPNQGYFGGLIERLSHGFSNIIYGPLEIPYRLKEDIKRYDPLRGILPGMLRGVGWTAIREVAGVFQVVTFYAPGLGPNLKDFDTDWLYA